MTAHAARELMHRPAELAAEELECVAGGLLSVLNEQAVVPYHHPITSPENTMFRPPSKKRA